MVVCMCNPSDDNLSFDDLCAFELGAYRASGAHMGMPLVAHDEMLPLALRDAVRDDIEGIAREAARLAQWLVGEECSAVFNSSSVTVYRTALGRYGCGAVVAQAAESGALLWCARSVAAQIGVRVDRELAALRRAA